MGRGPLYVLIKHLVEKKVLSHLNQPSEEQTRYFERMLGCLLYQDCYVQNSSGLVENFFFQQRFLPSYNDVIMLCNMVLSKLKEGSNFLPLKDSFGSMPAALL